MSTTSVSRRPRERNKRGEGDKLRVELVASASRLLETVSGEDALSLRAVAREAGVAAPSIYQHFPDKHELVLAVLAVRFAELRELLNHAGTLADGPEQELRARCYAYCQFAAEQPGNYRVMFSGIPASGSGSAPVEAAEAAEAAEVVKAVEELPGADLIDDLAAAVGRCAEAGLAGPFEPFQAATILWSALHGMVGLWASKPAFAWPPRNLMINQVLFAVCGLPLPAEG